MSAPPGGGVVLRHREDAEDVAQVGLEQAGVRLLFESVASGRLELPPEMLRELSLQPCCHSTCTPSPPIA